MALTASLIPYGTISQGPPHTLSSKTLAGCRQIIFFPFRISWTRVLSF